MLPGVAFFDVVGTEDKEADIEDELGELVDDHESAQNGEPYGGKTDCNMTECIKCGFFINHRIRGERNTLLCRPDNLEHVTWQKNKDEGGTGV